MRNCLQGSELEIRREHPRKILPGVPGNACRQALAPCVPLPGLWGPPGPELAMLTSNCSECGEERPPPHPRCSDKGRKPWGGWGAPALLAVTHAQRTQSQSSAWALGQHTPCFISASAHSW